MDRRRESRVESVMPVRIWGLDTYGQPFTQQVSARNVSSTGARLEGVCSRLKPGTAVQIEFNGRKAAFLVVWVGLHGARYQNRIGIQNLAGEEEIWDVNLKQCVAAAAQG